MGLEKRALNRCLKWDDVQVLHLFSESEYPAVSAFKSRKIMTCVHESKTHAEKSEKKNARLIFSLLRSEYGDRVLFDSVDKAAHKLTPFLLEPHDDSGKGIMIIDEKTGDVKNIMEESIILESIVHPISISRIYAEKEIAPEVIAKIKEYQDS